MEFLSQRPMLSTDPSTKGFDLSSGNIWIYPENYPLRNYQFEIVKSALYSNTLVCLPTGLGKTFVAAVIMYNFWRWYPQGKIVFLAPTKPLVAQQINACHDIMGIPSDETIELTGATDQKKRQAAWMKHRVIFATPQVFHKDLEKAIVPADRVKCVVVDEAHKALGKHSYCESIRLLSEQTQYFRVLALSATPGGKLDAVQEVVKNLHISHMELRDDTSPDILPYINERKLDIVLVSLGAELERFKDRYITIMDRHVRVLIQNNVLRGYASNISKGRIFHLQKEWQMKQNRGGNYGHISKTLTILMTMYHAYELMVRHGLRAFYNFYQNHLDKFWLSDEQELMRQLEEINYFLGPFPDIRPLPDGSIPEIPEDIRFGHNKFKKLKDLLLQHFESYENKEEETRAIVFVEYRDIVNEVYVLLLQSRPLIRPQKFVGQAGQKQKQQKIALEDFRSNKVNVLISTSVGEEGLDVGEVDLIVCFDISQHSPIRLVQRMGRTGRKRDGHIVVLVTDGKEHQTLKSSMSRRDSLNNKVLQSSGILNALHEESPRMVPDEFNPECQKMVITVVPKIQPKKGKRKAPESKKAKKPTETSSKAKNPRFLEPSTSHKPSGSQTSLMNFFKKPAAHEPTEEDEDIVRMEMNEIPTCSVSSKRFDQNIQEFLKNNNTIKPSDVRLLSSDNASLDFLTLCTMKQSEKEDTIINEFKSNPLLPSYYTNPKKYENFFDFEVPDFRILDCLANINDCVNSLRENENFVVHEISKDCDNFFISGRKSSPETSKFEAILDEFSSDSDTSVIQPIETTIVDFPDDEQVDWSANDFRSGFEDVLDESSNESKKSHGENNPEDNKTIYVPCQAPVDVLNEPGMFEDILDFSSDEGSPNCSPKYMKVQSKTREEIATTTKITDMSISDDSRGAFEDVLILSPEEKETDCRSNNVDKKCKTEETETIVKPEEISGNSKGAFEDILNFSSDESETDCNSRNQNIQPKEPKERATTIPEKISIKDTSKTFPAEMETRSNHSLNNINIRSRASEATVTKSLKETTNSNESNGAFEDLLNDLSNDSEIDCSLEIVKHEVKDEIAVTIPEKNSIQDDSYSFPDETETRHSNHSLNNVNIRSRASEETATTKNLRETKNGNELNGAFEDLLNDLSNDSETDCSLEIVKHEVKDEITSNSREFTSYNKDDTFVDTLIISDDETDRRLQLEPDVRVSKPISRIKNITESSSNSKSRDSPQKSIRVSTPILSYQIDESVDLLVNYEMKELTQLPVTVHDQRNFTTLLRSSEPSTSGLSKKAGYSVNFQLPASENKSIPKNFTKNSMVAEKVTFANAANLTDDDYETDCSIQSKSDVCGAKRVSKIKKSDFSIVNQSKNRIEESKEILTQRTDVEIDESVDLLADYEVKETSQISVAVDNQRHFKIFSNSTKSLARTASKEKKFTNLDTIISDDESETDCSFELEPKIVGSEKNKIKNSKKLPIENRPENSFQTSRRISTSRISTDIDEMVNFPDYSKQNLNLSKPSTSRLLNNFREDRNSQMTISERMREIDRINSRQISNLTKPFASPASKEKKLTNLETNISDDESETDCSLELEPKIVGSEKYKIKNSKKLPIESRLGNSFQTSRRNPTARISTNIDETLNFSDYSKQNDLNSSKPSTSGSSNNFREGRNSQMTISDRMREIDRINSRKISNSTKPFASTASRETKLTNLDTNISDDESETDSSFELEPEIVVSEKNRIKNSKKLLTENRPENSFQTEMVNFSDYSKQNGLNSLEPSTSGSSKSFRKDRDSQLTISQTMREIDRINSRENVNGKSNVNKINRGQENNKRSTSPVFGDHQRLSLSSRRSESSVYATARETWNSVEKLVGENAESEEDIFATDDLVVDSDFEAEINNIEKSVAVDLNTTQRGKSLDPVGKNSNEKATSIKNFFRKLNSPKISQHFIEKLSDRSENVSKVNSATTPFVSELNIDDLCSAVTRKSTVTESVADTVDIAEIEWESEERNNTHGSLKESVIKTIDSSNFNWKVEKVQNSTIKSIKESLPDTVDLNDCDWESGIINNSTPPLPKNPSSEIIPDDCDWGSDFEIFSSPSRATTSYRKNFERQESPGFSGLSKNFNNRESKLSKFTDSGWISASNPKRNLSLGRKLTKNLSTLSKKSLPRETKRDSDSENDFAVGRLEVTIAKQIESDFFVKPDPVDKLTTDKSLAMSRRVIRGPLTLRRNDVNKVVINELEKFTAPNNYTRQPEIRKKISGIGREKCASLDLDTRKRKKKQRGGEKRARARSEFIDDEAEVSTDCDHTSGSSGTDGELQDFVSYTQHHDDNVDMQAHYLQTIRSPYRARGFMMKKPKSPDPTIEIYSQALPDEPNSYIYDSFCVAEDDDVFEDSETSLEKRERRRKSRKRKRVESENKPNRKRRIIAPPSDASSSEDDFEKMRRQICEDSS